MHEMGSGLGSAMGGDGSSNLNLFELNKANEAVGLHDTPRANGEAEDKAQSQGKPKGKPQSSCHLSDEPVRISMDLQKRDWQGKNRVKFSVSNRYSEDAEVSLIVTLFSSRQLDTVKLDPVKVPAEGKTEVEVDLQSLGISHEPLEVTGDLYFDSESHFADGSEERGSGPPLHFHPQGKEIEAYTPAARLKRADKGHLSQKAKNMAKDLESIGDSNGDPQRPKLLSAFFEGETPGEDHEPRSTRDQPRDVLSSENAQTPETATRALVNVKFCFKVMTDYLDAGAGEDYWTNPNPLARGALGQEVNFYHWSSGLNLGWHYLEYNGSDRGCWSPSTTIPTGNYFVSFKSFGKVNGWTVNASELGSSQAVVQTLGLNVTSSGTKWITVGYHDVQNSYMATAQALRTHGGRSEYKGTAELRVGDCDETAYKTFGSDRWTAICTQPDNPADHLNKKFTIAHEIGHMIHDYNVDLFPQDYVLDVPGGGDCDPLVNGKGHYTTSTEKQSTAANEGFGSFYAADAFNNHNVGSNCWMKIGSIGPQGGRIACTGGGLALHPLKLMESRCANEGGTGNGTPTGLEGYGNETDWSRAFWDIHVHPSGATSFNTLLDWMLLANYGMNYRDAYERLRHTAPLIDSNLQQKWIGVAQTNGIDWVE